MDIKKLMTFLGNETEDLGNMDNDPCFCIFP